MGGMMAAACLALTISLPPALATPISGDTRNRSLRPADTTCADPLPSLPSDTWIYVSPSGSDQSPGTFAQPIQSLPEAQTLVRQMNADMTGNIIVCLEPGTYQLQAPLAFTPLDSGTNGYQIAWTSSPTDPAVISGADRITGWTLTDKSKNIWAAQVPAGLQTRQIYVNGMRATLASGAVRGTVVETAKGYQLFPNPILNWPDASGMDFGYLAALGLWTNAICPVASVHGADVVMAEPCWRNATQRSDNFVGWGNLTRPSYMENAYELLGKPGQFYLNGKTHTLYYVPRPGEDLQSPRTDVEAPFLQSLVSGAGTPTDPIQNLTFANLEFAYATWMRPSQPEGFAEMQANYTLTGPDAGHKQGLCQYARAGTCPYGDWTQTPGNVEFSYDQNLTFLDDRFVHLGAAGLDLDDGSQGDSVTGSVFTDISGNGIEVGNVDLPEATGSSQTRNITIEDNYLYGFPVEYQGGCPVIVGYAAGTLITHNQIDDVPYSGISIGWGGWPDKYGHPTEPNFSQNNTVSDNNIYNFMQLLSDGGGIYTQGITGDSWATGEHVTGNIVHDELDWSRALQSDDGASWDTYSDNVLYNNDYDWGVNHINHTQDCSIPVGAHQTRKCYYDPTMLSDNYWQQGDPDTGAKNDARLFIEKGNTVISGPAQAPASIVDNAGIQPQYSSILSWQPSVAAVPNSPQRLKALYAYNHDVYLTWRPGFAEGSDPVSSYTVKTCLLDAASYSGGCGQAVGQPLIISATDFDQQGYVEITGLRDGDDYSFTVTENSAAGSSTPSIPSDPIKPVSATPILPGKPKKLMVRPGMGAVSVQWYAPGSARARYYQFASQPILSYVVTAATSGGPLPTLTASSLAQVITSNGGSKSVFMVTGLTPGEKYQISVSAVTPAGLGKPAVSTWVTPLPDPSGN